MLSVGSFDDHPRSHASPTGQYRKGEKIARKAALLEMASLLGQLRTSQRSNNRPIFHPEPVRVWGGPRSLLAGAMRVSKDL